MWGGGRRKCTRSTRPRFVSPCRVAGMIFPLSLLRLDKSWKTGSLTRLGPRLAGRKPATIWGISGYGQGIVMTRSTWFCSMILPERWGWMSNSPVAPTVQIFVVYVVFVRTAKRLGGSFAGVSWFARVNGCNKSRRICGQFPTSFWETTRGRRKNTKRNWDCQPHKTDLVHEGKT